MGLIGRQSAVDIEGYQGTRHAVYLCNYHLVRIPKSRKPILVGSSLCPKCGSDRILRRGRLFKCLNCGLEAHRNAVGVLNMATLHSGGVAIELVMHPLFLMWDGMK